MVTSSIRRLLAIAPAVAALGFGLPTSADALLQGISDCNAGVVSGPAVLVRDLDCSGSPDVSIRLEKGTLDLDGHTIVTGDNYAVFCNNNCKIIGPGTITGNGSGIGSSRAVSVKDVTISVSGGIGAASGGGKLTLNRVTITGPMIGAVGGLAAQIVDSTISASAAGVVTGFIYPDGPGCKYGNLKVRRSSIGGTSLAACSGSGPEDHCGDIVSCRKPRLKDSTCTTSCQTGVAGPCTATWGVCSGD